MTKLTERYLLRNRQFYSTLGVQALGLAAPQLITGLVLMFRLGREW